MSILTACLPGYLLWECFLSKSNDYNQTGQAHGYSWAIYNFILLINWLQIYTSYLHE